MKRLILLTIAALTLTTVQVQAQSWLDALKSTATSVIDKVTGGKLTSNAIYGTWKYSQPGIKLSSSTNTLSDLGSSAITTSLQSKMATYYEKVGIRAGAFTYTFNEDGTFSSTIAGRTSSGTFTFDSETYKITLKYNSGLMSLGTISAYAYLSGSNLQLLFPMDNLLKVLTSLGSASSSLSTVTELLKSYDSIKIGFEFSK